jgi:acyl carrier protein
MNSLSADNLRAEICSFISSMLGTEVASHDNLKAKGLDSIAFLELVIFIEKRLKIPLPLDLLTAAPLTTVDALIAHLRSIEPTLQRM